MERRRKSLSATIVPVRLYRDDVEALVDLLRGESQGEVTIATEDHMLSDTAGLQQYEGRVLHELEVRSTSPYVSVHLSSHGARVYAAEDDVSSTGIFQKARAIVLERRRWFHWLVRETFVFFAAPMGAFGGASLIVQGGAWIAGGAALSVSCLLWSVASYHFNIRAGALVVPVRRREAPSFFRRNGDRLIVGAIIGIVSVVVTYAVTKL